LTELESNLEKGLTSAEADKRINVYGFNEFEKYKKNEWGRFSELFKDKFSKILFMAGLISFIISKMKVNHEWDSQYSLIEPLIIFTVLIINILVTFDQDSNAEILIEVELNSF
jgi:Ca2+-transporting ATPase